MPGDKTAEEMLEQLKTAIGAIAEITYLYYCTMLGKGLDEEDSLKLAMSFQESFVKSCFGGGMK